MSFVNFSVTLFKVSASFSLLNSLMIDNLSALLSTFPGVVTYLLWELRASTYWTNDGLVGNPDERQLAC